MTKGAQLRREIPVRGHEVPVNVVGANLRGVVAVTSSSSHCTSVRFGKYHNPFTEAILDSVTTPSPLSVEKALQRKQSRHLFPFAFGDAEIVQKLTFRELLAAPFFLKSERPEAVRS